MINLQLSDGAFKALSSFEKELEPRMSVSGDLGDIDDWASKLKGQVVRIAGVLHTAKHLRGNGFDTLCIEESTIHEAIEIAKYFIPHAQHIFSVMAEPKIVRDSRAILQWISEEKLQMFKFNECHVKFKGRLPTRKCVQEILNHLIERNFIREIPKQKRLSGRPAKFFEVNPEFHKK
jgi:replicative DNA helicase